MKTQDLFERSGDLSLNEIFDSNIPIDSWEPREQKNGRTGQQADIDIGDLRYRFFLETFSYKVNGELKEFINAGFTQISEDGKELFGLVFSDNKASTIIGCFVNAITKKIKDNELPCDAIIFAATDNVEKRIGIYLIAARMIAKYVGGAVSGKSHNLSGQTGKFVILMPKYSRISLEDEQAIADYCANKV